MDGKRLFEEGQEHLSRGLEVTQYTHVHSVDIWENVIKNYYLPAAVDGYPPAVEEVAKYYLRTERKQDGRSWVRKYRELTGCSRLVLIAKFGSGFLL